MLTVPPDQHRQITVPAARRFVSSIQNGLTRRLQSGDSVMAAALALVVDESTRADVAFWVGIEQKRGQPVAEEIRTYTGVLEKTGGQSRLNMLGLINPGLVGLEPSQKRALRELLRAIITYDPKS